MAAARGLYQQVASRFLSSPGSIGPADGPAVNAATTAATAAAAAAAAAGPSRTTSELGGQQPPKEQLTPDEFERAIDRLELLHFEALKEWWQRTQDGELHTQVLHTFMSAHEVGVIGVAWINTCFHSVLGCSE